MDGCQILGEDDATIEIGLGHELQGLLLGGDEPDVDVLPNIFHCFAEDRIIHELEEVLLGVGLGFGAESSIQIYVVLEPWGLFEPDDPMAFRKLHAHLQIHL